MRAGILLLALLAAFAASCDDAEPGVLDSGQGPAADGGLPDEDSGLGRDGAPDAFVPDAGAFPDAGGSPDAGSSADSGSAPDAVGSPDAGASPDAGSSPDASGSPDGGSGDCAATAGFCWLHPAGLGASLHAVSGAADDDVWAVGLDGVLVRLDGSGLHPWPSPTRSSLYDVHARTASDVWAVGDGGTVLHFNGSGWQSVAGITNDDLRAVFAFDANQVWIAGRRRVYWFNGQAIAESPLPFQYDVEGTALFAFAPDDVWLGTSFGTMLHYDGNAWSYSDTFYHNAPVSDLWGAGANDVWAVSDYGADVSRFDGSEWHRVPYVAGTSPENVAAVHGRSANDVWLAGELGLYHYDGQSFTRHDPPVDPYASVAPTGVRVGPSRTLVVGLAGHVFEWSGMGWSLISGPERGIYMRWFDIQAVAPNEVWFFGLGTSMRFDGQSFTEVPTAATSYRQDFVGSWSASGQEMWVVGIGEWGDNVQRYDGMSFSRVPTGGFNGPDWILGVWGSSASDLYFAAEGSSFRWNGSGFESLSVNAAFEAIHGTGPADVWAVSGTGGSSSVPAPSHNGIWHYDGQDWTQPVHDDVWWSTIHALAPDDVWAGGGGGTIKHWDGMAWSTMSIPGFTTADPQNAPFVGSFAARGPADVYAAAGGRLLHYDGQAWEILPSFGVGLSSVAVTSDGAVFVTGGADAVLRKR